MKKLTSSGKQRNFETGAKRDVAVGKGCFDLNSVMAPTLIAMQMERGMQKYGARNWEKGIPLSVFLASAERHLHAFKAGFDDEPHLDAALWNLQCLAEGRERIRQGIWPAHLDDLAKTYKGKNFQELLKHYA